MAPLPVLVLSPCWLELLLTEFVCLLDKNRPNANLHVVVYEPYLKR